VIRNLHPGPDKHQKLISFSRRGTQRGRRPPRPLFAVRNVTAHTPTVSVPITVLLFNGPLLCGFTVHVKGLKKSS